MGAGGRPEEAEAAAVPEEARGRPDASSALRLMTCASAAMRFSRSAASSACAGARAAF